MTRSLSRRDVSADFYHFAGTLMFLILCARAIVIAGVFLSSPTGFYGSAFLCFMAIKLKSDFANYNFRTCNFSLFVLPRHFFVSSGWNCVCWCRIDSIGPNPSDQAWQKILLSRGAVELQTFSPIERSFLKCLDFSDVLQFHCLCHWYICLFREGEVEVLFLSLLFCLSFFDCAVSLLVGLVCLLLLFQVCLWRGGWFCVLISTFICFLVSFFVG